jgi:diaminohydroxyphosphoribosylaminopyrimidine deaminase/5-amino-6-(5-phosphoribosylamino)uracil reductase
VFRRLGELEINEVWVEAGAVLNGALLAAGLIDELVVYQAASVLGASTRGMFDMPPPADLAARPQFRLQEVRWVGDDLRLIYIPATTLGKSS